MALRAVHKRILPLIIHVPRSILCKYQVKILECLGEEIALLIIATVVPTSHIRKVIEPELSFARLGESKEAIPCPLLVFRVFRHAVGVVIRLEELWAEVV